MSTSVSRRARQCLLRKHANSHFASISCVSAFMRYQQQKIVSALRFGLLFPPAPFLRWLHKGSTATAFPHTPNSEFSTVDGLKLWRFVNPSRSLASVAASVSPDDLPVLLVV